MGADGKAPVYKLLLEVKEVQEEQYLFASLLVPYLVHVAKTLIAALFVTVGSTVP